MAVRPPELRTIECKAMLCGVSGERELHLAELCAIWPIEPQPERQIGSIGTRARLDRRIDGERRAAEIGCNLGRAIQIGNPCAIGIQRDRTPWTCRDQTGSPIPAIVILCFTNI